MTKSLAKEDLQITTEEEYRALLRSLRRRKGFGIFFVQCTPVGGQELIAKVETDLPQKKIDVLKLDEPIDNLIERVKALPNQKQLNILFIVGLEKSLIEYIRPGYGGVGDYYKLDTVPPILNHLNWQRENFRDRFRHLYFIFLLPSFAIKYILHRAPDFADWRSGMIDIPTDVQFIEQETYRLRMDCTFEKYIHWTSQQRLERIAEIQTYLTENSDLEGSSELWFEQGNILLVNREYEWSINCFDQATKIIKDFFPAWYNRGIALGKLGRWEEAIASYEKALDIKSNYHKAWYNRGIALRNLGRFDEAITSYEKALDIKPDLHQAWNNRGSALRNLGRFDEAITSYEKALDIKPDDNLAWNNRGIALSNLSRFDEAITSYERALEINPDIHETWYQRGNALGKLDRLDEAIVSYKRAVEIKPYDHETWYSIARIYARQDQCDLAIETLEKAILLNNKYCNMAREDSDFENFHQDYRFQKLLENTVN